MPTEDIKRKVLDKDSRNDGQTSNPPKEEGHDFVKAGDLEESNPRKDKKIVMKIRDLDLWYGDFQALHGMDLDIYEKEITAFIGPSGCGKSTLIKSLNRMNDLVDSARIEGTVEVNGQDIYSGKRINLTQLRKDVGMVFQHPNPFPKSIYDNVAYGPRTHGIKDKNELDKIVERSLKQAAIWDEVKDYLDRNALSISGGQQQRVCIARALANEPKVLLMDEPTSALDPISTAKIEELVIELKNEYTIVMVTHNMQQASRVSDRTAFFLNGYIVEADDTKKIFTNPSNEDTNNYISGRFG